MTTDYDIMVLGTGNSAHICALSLQKAGFSVICQAAASDMRTALEGYSVLALTQSSRQLCEEIGIWDDLSPHICAVQSMDIYNAPQGSAATQLNLYQNNDADTSHPPAAYIVALDTLSNAVRQKLSESKLAQFSEQIETSQIDEYARAHLTNGDTLSANLCIDASGAHSPFRALCGINILQHDYQQAAFVGKVTCAAPHDQKAVQIFTSFGPLALLPAPDRDKDGGDRDGGDKDYALIWSQARHRAKAFLKASPEMVLHELNQHLSPIGIHAIASTAHATRPLSLLLADQYSAGAYIGLGETVHMIHPLAGQGLNLTLRDIHCLTKILSQSRAVGLPLYDPHCLSDYNQLRRADASALAAITHGLNIMFQTGEAGQIAAGWGMDYIARKTGKRTNPQTIFTDFAHFGLHT